MKFKISLDGIATEHDRFSQYEPELFPGLVYRLVDPKMVLLIFASGKVVFTGAKSRQNIYSAFKMVGPVISKYKKKDIQTIIAESQGR